MNVNEVAEVRDWLIERARECSPPDKDISESPVHPLACVIVDMLGEEIKENFLTLEVPQESKTLPKSTVADLVRAGSIIAVIKIIRNVLHLGLKESKDLFDANREKWEVAVKANGVIGRPFLT